MELTAEHGAQLLKVLRENGELRAQLASLVQSEELARSLAALTAAQRETERGLQALTLKVDALAAAQRETERRLQALTLKVDALAEAQRETERRLQALIEAQSDTAQTVRRLANVVGALRGEAMERRYRERAPAYFGRFLRGVRVVEVQEIEDRLEPALGPGELEDLYLIDLLVTGRPRRAPEAPDVWLALEVSGRVDRGDVERAVRRAGLLRRAGLRAVPAVAGEALTEGARDDAMSAAVAVFEDGRAENWEQALAHQA